ncbi:F-box/LRR-repeat protein At3g59190 [Coffea arabica]|uniref:F-box/LRR-repeat protein At3g59190 n=1 Tax=Coffea arabica TaxID=13443 RepID=A0A6P6WXF8_COFAR|nr:uncharacterized protein LOC113735277 [Coffea arabica]
MAEGSTSGLSELPQHIIHHILSYLSAEESTKTSLISKSWLSACQTSPKLEFNPHVYFSRKLNPARFWDWSKEKRREKYEEFFQHVKKALKPYSKQGLRINTVNFTLEATRDSQWNPLLEKCTKIAVKNGVRNLDFFIPECDLPAIVFRAKSLVDLSVREGNIKRMSVGEIICPGLRKLCLKWVSLDVEMFNNIIESCSFIEVLEVWYIQVFDDFKVTKLNNLKELTVRLFENQWVKVEAPKLELLTCTDDENWFEGEDGDEEDRLTCGIRFPASHYQNLKSLLFSGIGIDDTFFMDLACKFPNLEDLMVRYCQELESIKISSQSLKRIELMDNKKLVEAQFEVPKILAFEYSNVCDIIPRFLFATASSCWTSSICLWCREHVDVSWFVKLKELLASLFQSEVSLDIDFICSVAFDLNEIRDIVKIREPQEVQKLTIHFDWMFSLEKGFSALDGLFWVCRPKYVNTEWHDSLEKNDAVKFLYETLMFRRTQDQFQYSLQSKFWRHDLKEVNIEVLDRSICMIGDRVNFTTKGKNEHQQEDLDWENILNLLRNDGSFGTMVYFKLQWSRVMEKDGGNFET